MPTPTSPPPHSTEVLAGIHVFDELTCSLARHRSAGQTVTVRRPD